MIAALTTIVTVNLAAVLYNVSRALTPLWVRVVGEGNHIKMLYMRQVLKENALCVLGYNNCVNAVFLHVPGRQRRDITRDVLQFDASKGCFFTSAELIYRTLDLPIDAIAEVHGRNRHGEPYRFVFSSESNLFVPLHQNYVEKRPGKSVIAVDASYMGKRQDITSIAQRWLHCNVEFRDVLTYIVRDFLEEDIELYEDAVEAEDDEVVVIRVIYSDFSTDTLSSTKFQIKDTEDLFEENPCRNTKDDVRN